MQGFVPKTVKLEIYLPQQSLDAVLGALAQAGACQVGKYAFVSSYAPVQGTWMPQAGAQPYAGKVGELCRGTEYKLEVRCPAGAVPQALAAVRKHHPYEQPVIYVLPLWNEYWDEQP